MGGCEIIKFVKGSPSKVSRYTVWIYFFESRYVPTPLTEDDKTHHKRTHIQMHLPIANPCCVLYSVYIAGMMIYMYLLDCVIKIYVSYYYLQDEFSKLKDVSW